MKSLEIVNGYIKSIVDYLDNPQVKEDIDCLNIMCVGVSYKELQQIKADLVVLEILKKRNVNLSHLLYLFMKLEKGKIKDINDVHIAYNIFSNEESYLTLGEILKIKQWLEETEE